MQSIRVKKKDKKRSEGASVWEIRKENKQNSGKNGMGEKNSGSQ